MINIDQPIVTYSGDVVNWTIAEPLRPAPTGSKWAACESVGSLRAENRWWKHLVLADLVLNICKFEL